MLLIRNIYDPCLLYGKGSGKVVREFGSLMVDQHGLMNVLQFDMEAFVLFARIFMDKVGQVIEKRIVLPPGKRPRNSFTDHRKYVARLSIHPAYSNLLQNK